MKPIYLDHNGTTPPRREVIEKMSKVMSEKWSNPSSIHSFGRRGREVREEARREVAHLLGVSPTELVFTSGGTEANSLAILGVARWAKKRGERGHIISTRIEHHSILNLLDEVEEEGFEVTRLKVDESGQIKVKDLEEALREDTILVSIMAANNETGTVQPLEEIGEVLKDHRALFHSDGIQLFGKAHIECREWGIDMLSLSAHKLYGPQGVGALYIKRGTKLRPLPEGGHHEKGLRSGTENLPGIAGFGETCRLWKEEWEGEMAKMVLLRNQLEEGICKKFPRALINTHSEFRLPNTLNVTFPGVEGEKILFGLDLEKIAVSMGSACTSGELKPSHVLMAMGRSSKQALSSIRFSVGRTNTKLEIEKTLEVLEEVLPDYLKKPRQEEVTS